MGCKVTEIQQPDSLRHDHKPMETQHFSNTLLSTFSASQYFQIQIILLYFSHLPFKTKYSYYWVFKLRYCEHACTSRLAQTTSAL